MQRELPSLINDLEQYAQKVDFIVKQFEQRLAAKQLFTSDASFAEFVRKLAEDDKNKATFALAYFMDFNLNNIDLMVIKGFQAAIDWERDFHGRVKYENTALEKLRDNWDTAFGEQRNQADQSQVRIDHLSERADQLISVQKTRFDKSVESYDVRLDKAFERANDELNNITRTYDENLALHSSVRYWGLQEK